MARGQHWWQEPPWWALVVIVVGGLVLVIGTPVAMQRGEVPASAAAPSTETTEPTTAAPTPSAAPFQPPADTALLDTFTGRGGDDLDVAETGQEWTRTGDNPLILDDAGMTIDGTGAGYTTTDLGARPTSIGASVVFEPGEPGAVATLLVSKGSGLDLDNMGVHYYFDATGWTLQVREGGEVPFPTLDSGAYRLPADGRTEHHVNVALDGDTLTITNADGSTATVTDPRIGANISGDVAWEVFRSDQDMARPVFTRAWATTGR